MAKKSSRKSSSGDDALLWAIAAVVVAIVGVGTAIMLTRGKSSACADVKCTNQVKTGKTTWKTSKSECCKSRPSSKPVPTDTYCYRALRQGTGKGVKYFVQKANNKTTGGKCPTGWADQRNANLKAGSFKTIEVKKSANQCYNNYLMPTDYSTKKCLQAGDCDATSFTNDSCTTKWKKPAAKKAANKPTGQCCNPSGLAEGVCTGSTTKNACAGSCKWMPNGCNKENFRMRRWRR